MAQISIATDEKVYKVTKWLGVNQSQEGESRLLSGEAADMRNFRITAGGALRKRPGSLNVADLLNAFAVIADTGTTVTLLTETTESTASLTMYSTASVNEQGELILAGESAQVTNANADSHVGWYYRNTDGKVYRFAGIGRGQR